MFGGRAFKIATIRGIQIRVDLSWIFIAALITYSLYVNYTRSYGLSDAESLTFALISAVLFFGSILVHEGAHAVAGRLLGLPVRSITLIFWGGYTEVQADRAGARGEFLVSVVGPLSSLVLAGVFWGAERTVADPVWNGLFSYLAFINGAVAILNALPGLPLDGGRVLLAAIWGIGRSRDRAERVAAVVGTVVGWILVAGAIWTATRPQGDLGLAIFLGFIGWTMIASGRQSHQRIELRGHLRSGTARDAMRPPPATIPADLSLSEALDRYLRGREQERYPVVEVDGRVLGLVSFASARRTGSRDPMRPVRDGMEPLSTVPVVRPDEPLDAVLPMLGPGRTGLVMDGDRLLGTIAPDDVGAWFERRQGGTTEDAVPTQPTAAPPPRPDS